MSTKRRGVFARTLDSRHPGRQELVLFAGIYVLYDAARWAFHGQIEAARQHAHWVARLEHQLRFGIEGSVQHALGSGNSGLLLSNVYLAAQLIVLPAALVWVYHRDRAVYRRLRSTVAGTWLIAVPIFALYPVAPPRLAGVGIRDTVSHQAGMTLTGHSTLFYNPYAAVPSLHVGLAFAIAVATAAVMHHRWSKALALGWGPLVTVAVVATGNHFVFDAMAGVLVTTVAYGLTHVRVALHRPIRHRYRNSGPTLTPQPTRS